jgi:hypothetical protein
MNHKLLIALAVSTNDAVLAERQLDFIYRLHGRKQVGHLLIVANADLHAEMQAKLRVTAEMAFESVTETVAPAIAKVDANKKFLQLNNLFRHAAITAQTKFRWPWFWLEPDCAITSPTWIAQLAEAYESQPKKYLGVVSKTEKPFMARCGVYYPGAHYELDKLCQGDVPFPLATAEKVIPGAGHTDLVQYLALETPEDLAKISSSAAVVHGDKLGLFAESFSWSPPCDYPTVEPGHPLTDLAEKMCSNPPMQPDEVSKEIREFLETSVATPESIMENSPDNLRRLSPQEQIKAITGLNTPDNAPRLSRRQKREMMQNGGK